MQHQSSDLRKKAPVKRLRRRGALGDYEPATVDTHVKTLKAATMYTLFQCVGTLKYSVGSTDATCTSGFQTVFELGHRERTFVSSAISNNGASGGENKYFSFGNPWDTFFATRSRISSENAHQFIARNNLDKPQRLLDQIPARNISVNNIGEPEITLTGRHLILRADNVNSFPISSWSFYLGLCKMNREKNWEMLKKGYGRWQGFLVNKTVPVLQSLRHQVKGAFDKENIEVVSQKVEKYGQKQLDVISEYLEREFSMTEGTIDPQFQNENQSH
jgi:hypothetical protein